jgi:hypothetical protein
VTSAEVSRRRWDSDARYAELAVAAHRRIAYDYDVGNELYLLMLYETKIEAGFRTRSLRDAQLVRA